MVGREQPTERKRQGQLGTQESEVSADRVPVVGRARPAFHSVNREQSKWGENEGEGMGEAYLMDLF